MNQPEDLFELKIDETGRKSVYKIFRLSKLAFVMVILVEIIALYYSIRNFLRYRTSGTAKGEDYYYWELRIYTVYVIIYSLLAVLQFVLFLKFTQHAKRGIDLNNTVIFNRSFQWINKSLVVFLILAGLNVLYFISLIFFEPPVVN